jgi:hypothetical protein
MPNPHRRLEAAREVELGKDEAYAEQFSREQTDNRDLPQSRERIEITNNSVVEVVYGCPSNPAR